MLIYFKKIIKLTIVTFILGLLFSISTLWYFSLDLPDYKILANYKPPISSRVHSGEGQLIAEYALQKRLFIPYDSVPKNIIYSFLSAEDKNFFSHPGIDAKSITRAIINNLKNIYSEKRLQGASTITQQVAKNFLLTSEISIKRKIKEAILAFRIERAYSKERIMELYLNQIYLGEGTYGIAAASLEYFDKAVNDLKWMLGYNNPKNKIRNDEVLSRFYESLTAIEKFCFTKSLLPRKKNKTIKLEFAPDYSSSQSPVFLFDNHPKKVSMDIVYNIKAPVDEFGEYNLSRQEIDIINATHILPGYGLQLGYSQNYASMIRYLFPDLVTVSGWKSYALNMLIEEGYGNWAQEYHILKLKEELSIIARVIMEMRYYSGEINREDAKNYLMEMAFMKEDEAQLAQMESDLDYFSGTASFIGIMELNSLLAEYKRKQEDNFLLSEFHRLILKDGVIPLFELKKRVLPP